MSNHKFKVKCIDISTGGKKIVILNREDAKELDLMSMDRVRVIGKQGKDISAIVDLTETHVKKGELGVFDESMKALGLTSKSVVTVEPGEKPKSVSWIKRKMDGHELSQTQIEEIINDLMEEKLSDVELTALISALYIRGLNDAETLNLTRSVVHSGTMLDLDRHPIVDKHSTGGVPGNRTTMLIVPIVAAAGLTIPKTSSRSITSPAGTADAMEVLAPVALNEGEITEIVMKCNGCIVWGGGMNLAAADDKLIQIRHPLNLDPRGVLLASILAKKKAVGATKVLIDISIGKGAKVQTKEEARVLANDFMNLGAKLDMEVECIVTPGFDPVGYAVGPALEAREALRILERQEVSNELKRKSEIMSGILLEMGGVAKRGQGAPMARRILGDGRAMKKMKEIIELQGGDPKIKSGDVPVGKKQFSVTAKQRGRIHYMNVQAISAIARTAGAPVNKGAGLYLYVEKGDKIKKGDKLFTIFAESQRKLNAAQKLVERYPPVELEKVILGEYGTEPRPVFYEFG